MKSNVFARLKMTLCLLMLGLVEAQALTWTTTRNSDGTATIVKCENPGTDTLIVPHQINGETIKVIGASAFANLNITTLEIPETVDSIATKAFYNNTRLTSVRFDDAPTAKLVIGDYAFEKCTALTSVRFGTNVKKIGTGAFYNSPFTTPLTFNKGLEEIGTQAFYSCKIDGDMVLPSTLKKIGNLSFGPLWPSVGYKNETKSGWHFHNELILPESLEEIGTYAFAGARKMVTNLTLPKNLKKIGAYAFASYPVTGTLTIPASVEQIDNNAFSSMPLLSRVVVESGSNLTKLGKSIFGNDWHLRYIDLSNARKLTAATCTRANSSSPFYYLLNYTLVYLPATFTADYIPSGQVNFIYADAEGTFHCPSFLVCDSHWDYVPGAKDNVKVYANMYTNIKYHMTDEEKTELDNYYASLPTNRGFDLEIPHAFIAEKASYFRQIVRGNSDYIYATISLPYPGGTLPAGVTAYKLASTIKMDGSRNNEGLWFLSLDDTRLTSKTTNEAAGRLEANTPYILKITSKANLGGSNPTYPNYFDLYGWI